MDLEKELAHLMTIPVNKTQEQETDSSVTDSPLKSLSPQSQLALIVLMLVTFILFSIYFFPDDFSIGKFFMVVLFGGMLLKVLWAFPNLARSSYKWVFNHAKKGVFTLARDPVIQTRSYLHPLLLQAMVALRSQEYDLALVLFSHVGTICAGHPADPAWQVVHAIIKDLVGCITRLETVIFFRAMRKETVPYFKLVQKIPRAEALAEANKAIEDGTRALGIRDFNQASIKFYIAQAVYDVERARNKGTQAKNLLSSVTWGRFWTIIDSGIMKNFASETSGTEKDAFRKICTQAEGAEKHRALLAIAQETFNRGRYLIAANFFLRAKMICAFFKQEQGVRYASEMVEKSFILAEKHPTTSTTSI